LIDNYRKTNLQDGIEFQPTEIQQSLDIKSLDEDFSSMSTKKLTDRITFTANYNTKQFYREFVIPKPEGITLYPRYNSKYPGHIVAWNEKEFNGNWIDFKVKGRSDLVYETEQLENGDVKVTILVDLSRHLASNQNVPIIELPNKVRGINIEELNQRVILDVKNGDEKIIMVDKTPFIMSLFGSEYSIDENIIENYGIDKLQFETIGGVLVTYLNFTYVMGGEVNTTMYNQYDNTTDVIHTYNLTVTNTSVLSYPFSVTNYSHGNMSGLPNGTYSFSFNSSYYFPKSYFVLVENASQVLNYSSCQAGANFKTILINNGSSYLDNFTVVINNTVTNYTLNFTSPIGTTTLSLCLNASNYTYSITHPSYVNLSVNGSIELDYLDNITIDAHMPIWGTFILLDEKTQGIFNINDVDGIDFQLFCSNDTVLTTIIVPNATMYTNVTTLLIPCDYDYFRFNVYKGIDTYYRTLYLEPNLTLALNYYVYLIDLNTTTSVKTIFILDDLLGTYTRPSFWVYKNMINGSVLICEDYTDISDQVTFFFMENGEYNIELHSTNNPTVVYGGYIANSPRSNIVSPYTISLNFTTVTNTNVRYSMGTANSDATLDYYSAFYMDADTSLPTDNVTFLIYLNNATGTVIANETKYSNFTLGLFWMFNQSNINPANDTVVERMIIYRDGVIFRDVLKTISGRPPRLLDSFYNWVGADWMGWSIMIIITILALAATITSANIVAAVICFVALLLMFFHWFVISIALVIIALLLAALSFWKERSQE
jgi:hypothetical protein